LPRPIPPGDERRALDRAIAGAPPPYRLLFTLLRETGMRAGEVLALKVGDVMLAPGREGIRKGERRHGLARVIFHGQRGELRQRYRVGQEDQLGALGLVLNCVVLWNTRYLDAAINHLTEQGQEIRTEDMARLSPFTHRHINLLGRYTFTVPEAVVRGGLRPLRDLSTIDPLEDL